MDPVQPRSPLTRSLVESRALVVLASVLLSGCCGCGDELDAVYALPDTVHVAVSPSADVPGFEAVVQLLHEDDGILPEHLRDTGGNPLADTGDFEVSWKWVGSTAALLDAEFDLNFSGRRVEVTVPSGTIPSGTLSALPLTGFLEVSVECESSRDTLVVVFAAPSTLSDEVRPAHDSGDLPAVVVIQGERSGAPIGFEGSAVVGGVSVGKVSGTPTNPSRVTVLRARHAGSVQLDALTPAIEAVSVPMTLAARSVDVAVWIAATDDPSETLLKQALHEVRLADTILARNRVGLRLNPVLPNAGLHLQPVKVGASTMTKDLPCKRSGPSTVTGERWAADLFVNAGKGAPDFTDGSRLNVVYVDELFDDGGNLVYGMKCDHHPGEGGLVVVNVAHRAPTTLAHEIGHAFGLEYHSQQFAELKPWRHSNFMSDLKVENEWLRSLDQVTIGQAWIMNESKDSWANFPTGLTPGYVVGCPGQCPPVYFGIRKFQ